jgi:hypothetical protein
MKTLKKYWWVPILGLGIIAVFYFLIKKLNEPATKAGSSGSGGTSGGAASDGSDKLPKALEVPIAKNSVLRVANTPEVKAFLANYGGAASIKSQPKLSAPTIRTASPDTIIGASTGVLVKDGTYSFVEFSPAGATGSPFGDSPKEYISSQLVSYTPLTVTG